MLCQKFSKNFKIKDNLSISGAYYCEKCQKIVISNTHLKTRKIFPIYSGKGEFRKKLQKKKICKYADPNLQK